MSFTLGEDLHMIIEKLFVGDTYAAENSQRLQLLGVTLVIQALVGVPFKYPDQFTYYAVEIIDDPRSDLIHHLP